MVFAGDGNYAWFINTDPDVCKWTQTSKSPPTHPHTTAAYKSLHFLKRWLQTEKHDQCQGSGQLLVRNKMKSLLYSSYWVGSRSVYTGTLRHDRIYAEAIKIKGKRVSELVIWWVFFLSLALSHSHSSSVEHYETMKGRSLKFSKWSG